MLHFINFFVCFIIFVENWTFWVVVTQTIIILKFWNSNSPHQGLPSFACWRLKPFNCNFSKLFLGSTCSLFHSHWCFCSIVLAVNEWPDKDFLKHLTPKGGKYRYCLYMFCWPGRTLQPFGVVTTVVTMANFCTSPSLI